MLKISSLKAEQKQAVVGLLNGKDVMAILPTGFGKSVIFELFTLVKMHEDELTSLVIVSPLTSIMEDQIKDFEDLGISAAKLRCDEKTLEEIAGGKYRVIFGSAEAVLDERFTKVLKDGTMEISTYASSVVEFRIRQKFLQYWRRGLNSLSGNGQAQRRSESLTHISHRLWRNNSDCWKGEVPDLQIKVRAEAASRHLSCQEF